MSFLDRHDTEQAAWPFHPETYVDPDIARARRFPAQLLSAPMVIAFVWLLAERGSMESWAVSVPRLAAGRFDLLLLSMFAHGGLLHIIYNLSALLAFGPLVMERLGPRSARSYAAFMALFFGAGLAGTALWLALNPASTIPMLGASGAIFGLFGFLIRLPDPHGGPVPLAGPQLVTAMREWVRVQLPLIGVFLLLAIFGGEHFGLAWEAHLGGFVAGLVLCKPLWAWSGGRPDWVPADADG